MMPRKSPVLNPDRLLTSIVRESFYEFFREFWGQVIHEPLEDNWHVRYLCDELQKMAEKVFRNEPKEYDLIINIPPGTTKSTICSQMFPAWVWTRMPAAKFICVSYAHQLAVKDSLRTRDIVQSELYQRLFKIQLREDENTKGLFVNTKTGFRLSAGLGGAVTGYHAHFLLVDDPINPEEAFSESELKTASRWMDTTLPTRKVNKKVAPTILIQQRLHQNDPSGELLEKYKGKPGLKHICLPDRMSPKVNPPELKDCYVDGLLDPVRLSNAVLEEMKTKLGLYGYSAQFGQDPVPLGGGMFLTDLLNKDHSAPKRLVRQIRSWDKAGTEGGGAYTVGVLMGIDLVGHFWVLDVVRGQWGSTRREQIIRQTADMDGYDVEVLLEVEGGSGGKESGESTVRNLAGYRIITEHPTGDKVARAFGFSSQVGARNVTVLERPWTEDYIQEMRFFPNYKYKDQVDASAAAFNRLARRKRKAGGMW